MRPFETTGAERTMHSGTPIRKLLASVDDAVAGVLETEFQADDLFGADLSNLVSRCSSLQKRHGHLLQQAIASALRASGRFEVLTNQDFLITTAADSLIASTPPENLGRVHLRYNTEVARKVNVDLLVIDEDVGWAGAYDSKRGGGALTQRLLRPLVRDLEAVRLLLRSAMRDSGFTRVDEVAVGVIDIYGATGAPDHLRICKHELDEHFGVPVAEFVDLVTERTRARFREAIAPVLAELWGRCDAPSGRHETSESLHREDLLGAVERRPARFSGPRRRAAGGDAWANVAGGPATKGLEPWPTLFTYSRQTGRSTVR